MRKCVVDAKVPLGVNVVFQALIPPKEYFWYYGTELDFREEMVHSRLVRCHITVFSENDVK